MTTFMTKKGAVRTAEMREAFARGIAAGLPASEAARNAGYGARFALAKAAALVKQPGVAARVAELRGEIVPPPRHPTLSAMTLPEVRMQVAGEAYDLAQAAKAVNDRRSAIGALSLLSDVLGLKSHTMRVGDASPLDGLSHAALRQMLHVVQSARVEPDGAVTIDIEDEGEEPDADD